MCLKIQVGPNLARNALATVGRRESRDEGCIRSVERLVSRVECLRRTELSKLAACLLLIFPCSRRSALGSRLLRLRNSRLAPAHSQLSQDPREHLFSRQTVLRIGLQVIQTLIEFRKLFRATRGGVAPAYLPLTPLLKSYSGNISGLCWCFFCFTFNRTDWRLPSGTARSASLS
jgi:hypothetical protein